MADLLPWLWIALGVVALLIELHAQTVYLLAAVAGLLLGGLLGLFAVPVVGQLITIGVVLAGGFPAAGAYRRKHRDRLLPPLDVGLEVEVLATGPNGLRVTYRGSEWDATLRSGTCAAGERLRIAAVRGNTLELEAIPAARSQT